MILGGTMFMMTATSCTKKETKLVSSSIKSTNWSYNDPSWQISFSYEEIDQDVIDNGAVLVYMKLGTSSIQLPIVFTNDGYQSIVDAEIYVGGLTISWTDTDLIQPINPSEREFKIVVISSSGLAQNPNIDFKDYNAVKQAFKLNDKDSYHFVK